MATREQEETQQTDKGQVQCRAEPSAPEGWRRGHATRSQHDDAGRRAGRPHCEEVLCAVTKAGTGGQ